MIHHFQDTIPKSEQIEEGTIYISLKYNMTAHKCACGCGQLVPLPLSPNDWMVQYNGETISLSPSVGNGQLACGSHYIISSSKIVWLKKMNSAESSAQIKSESRVINRTSFLTRLVNLFKKKFI